MRWLLGFTLRCALCFVVWPALAARPEANATLQLAFIPQETTGASFAMLPGSVTSQAVAWVLEDHRPLDDRMVVGEGTANDDRPYPIRAGTDPMVFLREVSERCAREWGVQIQEDAERRLSVRVLRFFVTEDDQAVGSMYVGDVRITGALENRAGEQLWEGTAVGDARRYGRSRSRDNPNEVLSDAVKEAFANLLNDGGLQTAWRGERPASTSDAPRAPGLTPGEMLSEILKLKGDGFGTDVMVGYVKQQTLSMSLAAADLTAWKQAGVPEEVILAAMAQVPKPGAN